MSNPEYMRAYYRLYKAQILARMATPAVFAKRRARNFEIRKLVIEHYGGACACCGENTWEFLAIDHIAGGGVKHRRQIKRSSGSSFYAWLYTNKFPEGYQVLCHNCNNAKGFYGHCPHRAGAFNSK